jgi:L-alanine-DL-glutamate epimerase-like enolase superfamily enzyme
MNPDPAALRSALEAVPVTGLSAVRVRVPFRRPFATATGMWLHRESWIVLLEGPGGRVGLGEAVLEPDATEVEETILARAIRETAGRAKDGDLPDAEELELLGVPGRACRAALDSARLDLAMGPDGVEVPVNGTISFAAPREGAEAALQAIEAGFTTLKLKAGAERETEDLVARVRAIRQATGPAIRLRLDVNGAWDLATAEDRLAAIARFDIEYVEQPLAADDLAGAAELRRLVPVRVAADEAVYSAHAARRVLDEGAADVLVVKPARVGGPVAVAEIAAAADAAGVPVVLSTMFETGIGIALARACAARITAGPAASPTSGGAGASAPSPLAVLAHGLATAGLLEHDLLVVPLVIDAGLMAAPGGPGTGGLGIQLDDRALRRFGVEAVEAVEATG